MGSLLDPGFYNTRDRQTQTERERERHTHTQTHTHTHIKEWLCLENPQIY